MKYLIIILLTTNITALVALIASIIYLNKAIKVFDNLSKVNN